MSSAIAPIAQALFESLYPLARAAEEPEYRKHLLSQLGWDEDAAAELFVLGPQFVDWWQRGVAQQRELAAAISAKDGERQLVTGLLLLEIAFELSDALAARRGQPSDGPLSPDVREALWTELALALPEYLLLRWLRVHNSTLYWLLRITDVIEIEAVDGSAPSRVPAEVPRLRLERLGPLLAEPEAYIKGRYDWGFDAAARGYAFRHDSGAMAPMRHGRLLRVIERMGDDLGLYPRLSAVHQRYVGDLGSGRAGAARLFDPASRALADARQLTLPLVRGRGDDGPYVEVGLELIPLPGSRGPDTIDGLYLTNLAHGAVAGVLPLVEGWTLEVSGNVESGALGLRVLPGELKLERALPSSGFELRAVGKPAEPWVLIGSNTGTRLELRGVEAALSVTQAQSEVELRLSCAPKAPDGGPALLLRFAPSEGDSFLRELLGDEQLDVVFDVGFDWSSASGLKLTGEAGLCVTLPLNLTLGPATLDEVHVCLSVGPEGLSLLGAVTLEAHLGPVVCSLKDVGIEFRLAWGGAAAHRKTFGGLSLEADFKPPSGIGLGLNTPAVRAGGYLELAPEAHEYGGNAVVGVGPLSLTAVGLLDAELPEPPGWSLLLSICAEFTPVPLGFGFTLNGVGGVIGIGRTLDVKALQRTLADGALDALMFPEDPVGNGPAILDTLRELFPVAQGQTLVGPMVKIGWGAPTLIDADLGVLIELPDPMRITLLGQIASELPTRELGLVKLHLDTLGSFDFSALSLSIDAALYDSWLVGYTLAGGMAVRAEFGTAPSFLMSLGGFHPAYEAPKNFPALKRLSLGLSFSEDLRVEARSYLAFSSNMIQYGAEVVVTAKLRILTLDGGAGFDVLVNFSPFSFVADFHAWVDVMVGSKELLGVSVAAKFSGPEPWCFYGTATFRVLCKNWNFDVGFQLAGKKQSVPLDAVHVADLVCAALRQPGAWTQVGSAAPGVQLALGESVVAQADDGALPTLTLRPDQGLELRQRVAPLDVQLEKFGNHDLAGPSVLALERVTFGTLTLTSSADLEDWFAPDQYFRLSKDEKLDAPSFELLSAGKRLEAGGFGVGSRADRALDYETGLIDRDLDRRLSRKQTVRATGRRPKEAPRASSASSAAAPRGSARSRFRAQVPQPQLRSPSWQVIDLGSSWRSASQPRFAAARRVMLEQLQDNPALAGRLRVVPVTGTNQKAGAR